MHDLGIKAVVQGAVTVACDNLRTRLYGTQNISTRLGHSLVQAAPQSQVTGNGRRQGTTRAMHILAKNTLTVQKVSLIRQQQHIHEVITGQVASFQKDCAYLACFCPCVKLPLSFL